MKFSKHHNLYNDEADKLRKIRDLVGGIILIIILTIATSGLLKTIYIEAVRQEQFNLGPVK